LSSAKSSSRLREQEAKTFPRLGSPEQDKKRHIQTSSSMGHLKSEDDLQHSKGKKGGKLQISSTSIAQHKLKKVRTKPSLSRNSKGHTASILLRRDKKNINKGLLGSKKQYEPFSLKKNK